MRAPRTAPSAFKMAGVGTAGGEDVRGPENLTCRKRLRWLNRENESNSLQTYEKKKSAFFKEKKVISIWNAGQAGFPIVRKVRDLNPDPTSVQYIVWYNPEGSKAESQLRSFLTHTQPTEDPLPTAVPAKENWKDFVHAAQR